MKTDKRLIDANALIKGFEGAGFGDHSLIESVLAAGVYAGIENAPTIDAVEVVRCRECKNTYDPLLLNEGWIFYTFWKKPTRCDGFCHMGAKMDAKDMDVPTKDGGAD